VRLLTPKGTAQVPATGIAWIGEEEYAAMPASSQVSPQVRFRFQNGPEDKIVLQDKFPNLDSAVPIWEKLIILPDFYSKKPRVSLMMLIVLIIFFCMSSS